MTNWKCRAGIHTWKTIARNEKYHTKQCIDCGKIVKGDHKYKRLFRPIDDKYHEERVVCKDCWYGTDWEKKIHIFALKNSEDPCWYNGKCDCGYEVEKYERRLHFRNSRWVRERYLYNDSCEIGGYCVHCGYQFSFREPKYEHQWSAPHYAGPYTCERVRECRRCGKVEIVDVSHIFDHTEHEGDKIIKICSRCGERKVVK